MINNEIALEDIERFMLSLNIDPLKRKKLVSYIDRLCEFIENEMVLVNDCSELEYNLLEPVKDDKGNIILSILTFKNKRITLQNYDAINKKELSDIEKSKKIISITTGIEPAILTKISLDDMMYLNEIAVVFMPAQ
jgi:GTP-dependent phosphoenolpyruvate carboxykinase